MNHHPVSMPPYGQVPMPLPQRLHEVPYSPMPPNMRPHQGYQGYYQPHMTGPIPQYPPQYAPHWYPYQHMQHHHHHHHPPVPRTYAPYPQHQMQQAHTSGVNMAPAHGPHQHLPHPTHPVPPNHHHSPGSSSQSQFTSQTNPLSSTPIQSPFSPPPSGTPSTANAQPETPPSTSSGFSKTGSESSSSSRTHHFFPPLPWSSVGDQPFPNKAKQQRRRIMRSQLGTSPVSFPLEEHSAIAESNTTAQKPQQKPDHKDLRNEQPPATAKEQLSTSSNPVETTASQISHQPSDSRSTDPTTTSTAGTAETAKRQPTPTRQSRNIHPTGVVAPVVPAVPLLPLSPKSHRHAQQDSMSTASSTSQTLHQDSSTENNGGLSSTSISAAPNITPPASAEASKPVSPPAPPKSWADLVRSKMVVRPSTTSNHSSQLANGLGPAKNETLSDVLTTIDVTATDTSGKIAFLKPRGLVNTGNMCYMNSVLQILVFTIPFYEFLARVGQRSSYSFKSDTPLIDAMILFMREFSVIDSAESFERLRLRLKSEELEQYGEPFAPEYAYQVIRQLPRFRDMRRGHQQDAQEFLGFLLEELHEECAHAMRSGSSINSGTSTPTEMSSSIAESLENEGGWMEVGHKQKPAITRSSGAIVTESPVTKIFGGKLRSEWKVPGNKNSVTLEPYQPLQLDIGSPQVNNIVDALKGLTRPESMQGDFNSSRGNRVTATKQVFIETLPPVLILHLKRFQYDGATKRTEKIWKKVGYPLELEIPKEVFPPQVRNKMTMHGGLPRYQLTGVIYHHGKHAGGGHYTVDVRRQDGREWIRLDDTLIRRVRSEEVAEGGSEEDPKVLAAALERHNQRSTSEQRGNMFEQIEDEDDDDDGKHDDQAWSQVNGHSRNKASTATADTPTTTAKSGSLTPRDRPTTAKDNKVAYLLFYRRVTS